MAFSTVSFLVRGAVVTDNDGLVSTASLDGNGYGFATWPSAYEDPRRAPFRVQRQGGMHGHRSYVHFIVH